MILHGEQDLEIHRPIPTSGTVEHRPRVVVALRQGQGRPWSPSRSSRATVGHPLFTNRFTIFARGEGGFGGDPDAGRPGNEPPDRAPDAVVESPTMRHQALLYRLSGDKNPLHADPDFAKLGGFDTPDPARPVHLRDRLQGGRRHAPRRRRHRGGPLPGALHRRRLPRRDGRHPMWRGTASCCSRPPSRSATPPGSPTASSRRAAARPLRAHDAAHGGAGFSRGALQAGSTVRVRATPGGAPARAGATATSTAARSPTPRSAHASRRWRSRPRGPRSGSARIPAATSRRSGATRPGAASTATTTPGGSVATARSSTACRTSRGAFRPCARCATSGSTAAAPSIASPSWRARCGCWTTASSGSGTRSTRGSTAPTGSRPSAASTSACTATPWCSSTWPSTAWSASRRSRPPASSPSSRHCSVAGPVRRISWPGSRPAAGST